jgi:hypothetical protein
MTACINFIHVTMFVYPIHDYLIILLSSYILYNRGVNPENGGNSAHPSKAKEHMHHDIKYMELDDTINTTMQKTYQLEVLM